VLAGLAAGEKVVASGQFLLDPRPASAVFPPGRLDRRMIAAIIRSSVQARNLVLILAAA
jgi:hypothetical protein